MLKRNGFMKVVSLLSLSMLFIATAVSCGGGDGSSGPSNITYSNPDQAASSQTMGMAVMGTALSTTGLAVGTGTTSVPAYAAKRKTTTDSISKLNPDLKKVIDRMISRVHAPAVKSSLSKALAPTVRQATSATTIILTSADGVCMVSGSITVTYTDNSTPGITDRSATITFNNCQDDTGGFYTWMTGSMNSTEYVTTTPASSNYTLAVNNFMISVYTDAGFTTLSERDVMNGTFGALDNVTSGSNTANGSFTMTLYDPSGTISASYSFTNVSDEWSDTVDYIASPMTGTLQHILNGSFRFELLLGGTSLGSLTFGMTNLTDKMTFNSDVTRDEWLDGSYYINWTPDWTGYGCPEGTVTFDTAESDPLHYADQSPFSCPISGTITANNALVQIGASAGLPPYQIKITVGTVYVIYTDCTWLDGAGGYCS